MTVGLTFIKKKKNRYYEGMKLRVRSRRNENT